MVRPVFDDPNDPNDPTGEGGGGGGGGGTVGYSGTTIFDLNFTKHEASSIIRVLIYANMSSPDDIQFYSYIVLDGGVAQICSANIVLDTGNSRGLMPLSPFAYLTDVGAGSHNIKFVVRNVETDNVGLTVLAGATMEVTELKQGAR